MYIYAFNNPIMYSDPNGNWPSWNEFTNWVESAWGFLVYAVESAYYNLEMTAGITIGMGGEFACGKSSIELGSRMDMLGIQFKDGKLKFSREGRSAACITIMGFTVGPQSDTYEALDGGVEENDDPYYWDFGLSKTKSAAFVIGYQYGISFSTKDYVNELVAYFRG